MSAAVLVIDQGTTSTRAIVFDDDGSPVAFAREEIPQIFPRPGWVEHDPNSLWSSAISTARDALRRAACEPASLAAIGIANQRETALIWDRSTGKPIGNAIVWQDRRTAQACAALKDRGCEPQVTARTGLLLDPYFSATKIAWLLDAVPGARAAAARGTLAFGTVDCFLLWRLTNGAVHATDATNASRTLLYDIHKGMWDDDMLRLFDVPAAILPEVRDTAAEYGAQRARDFGAAVPIRALVGDQQSALIGQACVAPGMVKATYGTGGFLLLNAGEAATPSRNRLLTTVAYQWSGERAYALEGSIFSAGATVQWLRDGLGILATAVEAGALAAASDPAQGRLLRARLRRSGRAALELRGARRSSAASRAGRRARKSFGRRSRASATRPATSSRRCNPTRAGRSRSFASTEAWRRATGQCSSWPTFWPSGSIGRSGSRRRRRAPPSPPAGRPASIPARIRSPKSAGGIASSSRNGRGDARAALSGMAGGGAKGAAIRKRLQRAECVQRIRAANGLPLTGRRRVSALGLQPCSLVTGKRTGKASFFAALVKTNTKENKDSNDLREVPAQRNREVFRAGSGR